MDLPDRGQQMYGPPKSAARRIQPAEEEVFLTISDQKPDPETACLQEESRQEMLKLCRQLPPPYNEIAEAHFYEEQSIREIAKEKGRNLRTVQTQVYRAKGLLKKRLKGGAADGKTDRTPD